jgi:hypothetical protein
MTLLGKSRRLPSNAMGGSFCRGMSSVPLAFKRHGQDRIFDLPNRVCRDSGGEFFTTGFQWLRLTLLGRTEPSSPGLPILRQGASHAFLNSPLVLILGRVVDVTNGVRIRTAPKPPHMARDPGYSLRFTPARCVTSSARVRSLWHP